jgi:hypothetical protein
MFGATVQNLVAGRPGARDCATLDEMFGTVFNWRRHKCSRLLNNIQMSSFGLQPGQGFKVSVSLCCKCCLSPNFEKQEVLERMLSVLQNDKSVSRLKVIF